MTGEELLLCLGYLEGGRMGEGLAGWFDDVF